MPTGALLSAHIKIYDKYKLKLFHLFVGVSCLHLSAHCGSFSTSLIILLRNWFLFRFLFFFVLNFIFRMKYLTRFFAVIVCSVVSI